MLYVDCQSHVFPPAYAELLIRNRGWVRTVKQAGDYLVSYGDIQNFNLSLDSYELEKKLKDMDAAGIDASVLSMNIPGPEMLDAELQAEGARMCNDYMAELCARRPDRLAGIAVLPFHDPQATLAEFGRARGELGLRAVNLYSHIGGRPVDDPAFESFYAEAERSGTPLVIHPTVPAWSEVIKDYSMITMFGLMVDHSIAMLRLIMGGVLERHPGLKLVHPHCGGVLPYLMPRIVEQTEVKRRGREHIKKSPELYYKQVWLDIVSPALEAVRFAYDFAGPERLLFGSDHPWVGIPMIKRLLEELPVDKSAKEKIAGLNAVELFKLR